MIGYLLLLLMTASAVACPKEARSRAIANRVLDTTPLIDGHNDWPMNMANLINNQLERVDFRQNLTNDPVWGTANCATCRTDIPRLRAGKLGTQFWVAFVECTTQYKDAVEQTLEQIDVIHRVLDKYNEDFQLVTTAQGILDTFAAGKIGGMIAIEGGHGIDSRLAILRLYYKLGVRCFTLTHLCSTPWCDASTVDQPGEVPVHNGLTDFGKIVIHELNRLGIMVDLSHVSKQVQIDALAETMAPVIYSHSSAYTLCDSHRNVHDDVLQLVKENNGVVMVNFYNYFVSCSKVATIQQVADHINHIRRVAGVDHVGIGSDFDGIEVAPEGLEDVSKYPDLFTLLAADTVEPWSEDELRKLAGLNLIRVFQQVEQVRDQLSSSSPHEDLIPAADLGNNTQCITR